MSTEPRHPGSACWNAYPIAESDSELLALDLPVTITVQATDQLGAGLDPSPTEFVSQLTREIVCGSERLGSAGFVEHSRHRVHHYTTQTG
jgi:hypothetical protein